MSWHAMQPHPSLAATETAAALTQTSCNSPELGRLVFHNAHPLVAFPDLTLSLMSYALRSYGRSWRLLVAMPREEPFVKQIRLTGDQLLFKVLIHILDTGLAFDQPLLL